MSKQKSTNKVQEKIIAAPSNTSYKQQIWWISISLFIISFLLYANTIGHDYALDDIIYTLKNKFIQEGNVKEIFTKGSLLGVNGPNDQYRPLILLNFLIETKIFGNNPHVNHFFNVALFASTCVMLFHFLLKLLRGYHIALPVLITLLFAFHPIHTEVVANIKSRDELLGFFLDILSFYFVLKYAEGDGRKYLFLSLLFYFCGLLSKENTITYFALIPLLLFFFTKITPRKIVAITIPFFVLILVNLFIRQEVLGSVTLNYKAEVINNSLMAATNMGDMFATSFLMMGKYVVLLFFPHPLSWDYSFNQIPIVSWANGYAIVSLLLYMAMGIYVITRSLKKDVFAFSILLFFITIFITSNLMIKINASFAERFLYAPSLAFCIAIPFLFFRVMRIQPKAPVLEKKGLLIGFFAIVLILFGIKLVNRNMDWKNNYTITASGIVASPNSFRAHSSFGNVMREKALEEKDKTAKQPLLSAAAEAYQKAIRIFDKDFNIWYNAAVTYYELGETDQAMASYKRALLLRPHDPSTLEDIGVIYLNQKKYDDAIAAFLEVTSYNNNSLNAYINLANAYQQKNDYANAARYLETAGKRSIGNKSVSQTLANAYMNMGINYFKLKDYENATKNFEESLKYDPNSAAAFTNMGAALQNMQQYEKAIFYAEKGFALDPKNKNTIRNLAMLYGKIGDTGKAEKFAAMANE